MPFFPTGTVYVGKVPWNNNYNHVRWYTSTTSQYNDIRALCGEEIPVQNYTYIRWGNSIKVMQNAELLKHYNYVMFMNANSNYAMWVYAFIVECNYINDNTTELVLETDIFQTYLFDVDMSNRVFIERRHVTKESDKIGDWIQPEPNLTGGDYWEFTDNVDEYVESLAFKLDTLIIDSTADVDYDGNTEPQRRVDVYGGYYNGILSGAGKFAFEMNQSWASDEYSGERMLWDLNKVGAAEAVCDVFMFPSAFLSTTDQQARVGNGMMNAGNYGRAWVKHRMNPKQMGAPKLYVDVKIPTTYQNGTTPHNNKVLTYPFRFVRVVAPTGNYVDYKYELFHVPENWGDHEPPAGYVSFIMYCNPFSTSNAVIKPQCYLGMGAPPEYALTFPCCIKASWQYSAYLNWAAQHAVSNAINFAADIAMIGIPIPHVKGAGGAVKALGAAGKIYKESSLFAKSKGASRATQMSFGATSAKHYYKETTPLDVWAEKLSIGGEYGAAGGILGLANLGSDIAYNTAQPSAFRGNSDMPSIYEGGNEHAYEIKFKPMQLRREIIRIYDDFFDMYGYAYNHIGGMTGKIRTLWSYWKTAAATFKSIRDSGFGVGAPAEVVAAFNAIFDNGVTLWHTTSGFGNYDGANNT